MNEFRRDFEDAHPDQLVKGGLIVEGGNLLTSSAFTPWYFKATR
jgi:hypothetical protein